MTQHSKKPHPDGRDFNTPLQQWPAFQPMFNLANPWSWGGFAPIAAQNTRAALMAIDASEGLFSAWRSMLDGSASMIRQQQDAALHMLRSQFADMAEGSAPQGHASSAPAFFMPMLALTKAYEQMSGAVMDAQRDALEAFAQQQKPH